MQRYQDVPSDASTNLAVALPNENLESHAALATVAPRKRLQNRIISGEQVASSVQDEECHRECHQHHGPEVHHRAFDLGLFAIEPKTLAIRSLERGPDAASLRVSYASLARPVSVRRFERSVLRQRQRWRT